MNSENNNNLHTLDDSVVIPTLEFRSDDSRQDVLDISQLLPESGVNSSNLKQFVKISSSGVFVDSSGAGQFSAANQREFDGERQGSPSHLAIFQILRQR